jgi:hypothetical protein
MVVMADLVLAPPDYLLFIYVCELGEDMSKQQVKHTWVVPPFWVSVSSFRHLRCAGLSYV